MSWITKMKQKTISLSPFSVAHDLSKNDQRDPMNAEVVKGSNFDHKFVYLFLSCQLPGRKKQLPCYIGTVACFCLILVICQYYVSYKRNEISPKAQNRFHHYFCSLGMPTG